MAIPPSTPEGRRMLAEALRCYVEQTRQPTLFEVITRAPAARDHWKQSLVFSADPAHGSDKTTVVVARYEHQTVTILEVLQE